MERDSVCGTAQRLAGGRERGVPREGAGPEGGGVGGWKGKTRDDLRDETQLVTTKGRTLPGVEQTRRDRRGEEAERVEHPHREKFEIRKERWKLD